jgi:hypothetical protein
MTLTEIKAAVEAGQTVHWGSPLYSVVKDKLGQWLIDCPSTGGCWGLTRMDGVTLNGAENQFFTLPPRLKRKPLMKTKQMDAPMLKELGAHCVRKTGAMFELHFDHWTVVMNRVQLRKLAAEIMALANDK